MQPELAKALLVQMAASGIDTPAAREVARELQKVALTPGARGTPINVQATLAAGGGFMGRAAQAIRYLITGVTPQTWFSPAQPLTPAAGKEGDGTVGRRFDFPVGMNINYTPRGEGAPGGVPFWVLRNLAENYDLLRLVIETRKDQIASFEWEIVAKDEDADSAPEKAQVKRVTEFFERPSPELDWLEWLRTLVEDDLVLGSVALYPRVARGGQLHSLVPIDASTIKKLVDESGYQPEAPNPAYQQVMKGIPAVDYRACMALPAPGADELVYWIRNPRTWKLYGMSPVEQILVTVNIAMRRQQFQMEYYTEGSIPDMIIGLPENVTPDQIKEFQQWWDSILAGNTALRRKVRFVPEMKGIINPKDAQVVLADEMDQWLARIICFAFSVAPTALIKMTNRAQSEQVAETAKEEGLMPFLKWLEWKLTWVANNLLMCPDVKFAFKLAQEVDPQVKADTNSIYVKNGILTINEAREDIGHGPQPGGEKLIVITANGPVALKENIDRSAKDALEPPPPPPTMAPVGKPTDGPKPVAEKMELHVHSAPITVNTPDVRVAPAAVTVNSPVNLPAIKVDAPSIKMGEHHVHIAPAPAPDVFVNVEGSPTTVHADMRSENGEPMEKTIVAHKDKDGKMVATVTAKRKAA